MSDQYNIEDADKSELQIEINGMPIANIFRVPMHQVLPVGAGALLHLLPAPYYADADMPANACCRARS